MLTDSASGLMTRGFQFFFVMTKTYVQRIAGRLRWVRVLNNQSLKDIEKATGISAQTIARYETGAIPINTQNLEKVCDALKFSPMRMCGSSEHFTRGVGNLIQNHE